METELSGSRKWEKEGSWYTTQTESWYFCFVALSGVIPCSQGKFIFLMLL